MNPPPNSDPAPVESGGFTPGQKVGQGRFTLVRFLGKGGMGIVWLAEDTRLGQPVALKFLPPQIRADADALDDMRRETVRSIKLSHPGIIRIHDLHEHADELFIAMEFVDGVTLAALKREAPGRLLAWEQARPLLRQLCDALDYAHGENVIHRDLKPANMMLDARGRLKLADFGIAAVVNDSMSRVSLKHSTSGTMAYMSPQQMNGQRPQPSDDIYALGATLYELLTSRPPFYTGNITHQVQEVAATPLTERLAELELQNEIPAAVGALVMACLAKEPAQRPQSARAVADWIGLESGTQPKTGALAEQVSREDPAGAEQEAAGDGMDETMEAEEPAATTGQAGLWIGVAIVVALLAGAGIWWVKRPPAQTAGTTGPAAAAGQSGPQAPASAPVAAPAGGPVVNLLPLVNLPGDVVSGSWSRTAEGLMVQTPATASAVRLPYEPPEEYDFEIEFTPKGGGLNVNQYLSVQGHSFAWKLNAHGRTPPLYCFTMWDGDKNAPEVSVTRPVTLEIGKRYTSKIEVRRSGMRALVDGVEFLKWSGKYDRFSMEDVFKLGDDRHLGVGSWKRSVVFHRIEVREVTGTGKITNGRVTTTAPAATTMVASRFTNSLGMVFVPLPGTDTRFCIWETRVQDFEAFVKDAKYYDADKPMQSVGDDAARWTERGHTWRDPGFPQTPVHPVVGVVWNDAQAFCGWLTAKERKAERISRAEAYRLPNDLEWSQAIGLGPETGNTPAERRLKILGVYPWGSQWPPPPNVGNLGGSEVVTENWPKSMPPLPDYHDAFPRTAPVGSFPPNQLGIYDLVGNVAEYLEDWFDATHQSHVRRGSSWDHSYSPTIRTNMFSSNRYGTGDHRRDTIGFRVVLTGTPPGGAAAAGANSASGWMPLFADRKLNGWTALPAAEWRFEADGSIACLGTKGMIFSPTAHTNVAFKAEIKLGPGANGGMFIRAERRTGQATGYEAQAENSSVDARKTGSLYKFADVYEHLANDNEWFTEQIVAIGNRIIVQVNGRTTADFVDTANTFKAGYLGLQHNTLNVLIQYRNVMVKPLPTDAAAAWVMVRADLPTVAPSAK